MFDEVLHREVVAVMGLNPSDFETQPMRMQQINSDDKSPVARMPGQRRRYEWSVRRARMQWQQGGRRTYNSGIGSRLLSGLNKPPLNEQMAFYPADYTSDIGTLPFCAVLPDNPLGLHFSLPPIMEMGADALMKHHEVQRQHLPFGAQTVVAIYVYCYELLHEEDGDQIYRAMNDAMRELNGEHIAFWRPLIWQIDVALRALPPFTGVCYRGIGMRLDPDTYAVGQTVCWHTFSSASQNRWLAEEVAEGDHGTLFHLSSSSARMVGAISRFPEEQEVIFCLNSSFTVRPAQQYVADLAALEGHLDHVALIQHRAPGQGLEVLSPRDIACTLHIPNEVAVGMQALQDMDVAVARLSTNTPAAFLMPARDNVLLSPPYPNSISESPRSMTSPHGVNGTLVDHYPPILSGANLLGDFYDLPPEVP